MVLLKRAVNPAVWLIRSACANAPPAQVSVVAMQRGEHLEPFKTRSGGTLEILYLGELTAEVSQAPAVQT